MFVLFAEIADQSRSSPSEEAEGSSSSSSATESDSINGSRDVKANIGGGKAPFYAKGRGLSLPPQQQQHFNAQQQQQQQQLRCPSLPPSSLKHLGGLPPAQSLSSMTMDASARFRGKASPPGSLDMGYHTMLHSNSTDAGSRATPTSSLDAGGSDVWDVRATRTPISDLHILTHNAKHLPVSKNSNGSPLRQQAQVHRDAVSERGLASMPDPVVLRILSFLRSDELVRCARVCRRFYFLAWDPCLWRGINLEGAGANLDVDLALKTIIRLLCRNASKLEVESLQLGGCPRLTDRGLAIVARRCPNLRRLEVQHCVNLTNGGLMDLVSRCQVINHLDVSGKKKKNIS